MPVGYVRLNTSRFSAAGAGCSCALAVLLLLVGSNALQNAVAEGDTRTITMHHIHTGEDITITYKRNGRYDEAALEKLNWFLRDWRRNKETRMNPHLIDLLWEVHRETGSKQPIDVVCGYRSAQTNAMLRRRSHGVARFSQHVLGNAIDFFIPGAPLEQLRVIGLRMQRGGVGFYPHSGSPFVHMDVGGIRMWPRMTRQQLLHVFPDGRTAYIPSDGHPLAGYAQALADIKKRNRDLADDSIATADNRDVHAKLVLTSDDVQTGPQPIAAARAPVHAVRDPDALTVAAAAPPQPAPTAPATPSPQSGGLAQTLNPLLTALERVAIQKRREREAAAAATAAASAQPKLIQASAFPTANGSKPAASGSDSAGGEADHLTPSQIILARGYWAGPPDTNGNGQQSSEATGVGARAAEQQTAAAAGETTSALSPWTGQITALSRGLPFAYAEPPRAEAPLTFSPAGVPGFAASPPRHAAAAPPSLPAATTVAVKRDPGARVSTVFSAPPRLSATMKARAATEDAANDPWLTAVMMSPSVHRYLTVLRLGAQDYRTLAPLVSKPDNALLMTFTINPDRALSSDHFSGTAVQFPATVSYQTHTAEAQ